MLALAGVAATATLGAAMIALPQPASAVACTGQVSYASSTNTLKLTSGELDLPELLARCAAAPLVETDPATNTWLLKANVIVQNGATLHVRGTGTGTGTGVPPADAVDTLQLLSLTDNSSRDVVNLTANYGNLTFESTQVTSWDPAANAGNGGPDVDPGVGTAAPGNTTNGIGRAFVRAVSSLDPVTGAPLESRLDITSSQLGYLGYYYSESYGVAFKSRGCDVDHQSVCAALNVYGSERNSRFHHNYMGTYTFDAFQMVFDHNEYDHNVMYGLDPHDDSDQLTITNNHAHDNGDHGIICSQRCDHLTITGNESDHNGYPTPYVPPGDDNVGDNQVHGIMIHRGVTDSLIANNTVHDNNGSGIAVFDSFDNTIRDNTISTNLYGLRTSVGSHDNVYTGNTVTASRQYAINAYPGVKDTAYYGIPSGRPTAERFTGNVLNGSGSNLVNLLQTDGFQLVDNTVSGTVGKTAADSSTGVFWSSDSAPGLGLYLTNSSRSANATVRLPLSAFKVSPGAAGAVTLQDPGGRLVDVSNVSPFATVTAAMGSVGSATAVYTLDTALIGATSSSTVTPRPVTVVPKTGTIQARISSFTSATTKHLYLQSAAVGTTAAVSWGGLTPGTTYYVRDNNTNKQAYVATASGTIAFTFTESSGGPHDVTVKTS